MLLQVAVRLLLLLLQRVELEVDVLVVLLVSGALVLEILFDLGDVAAHVLAHGLHLADTLTAAKEHHGRIFMVLSSTYELIMC